MKLVEDPALIAQLDGAPAGKRIDDPVILARLDHDIDITGSVDDVRTQLKKLSGDDRQKALDLWAKHYVATERKVGGIAGVGMAADNVARTLARGTLVGPFLDEMTAGTEAARHALGLGGSPYDEAVAYQRARDKAVDTDYPIASLAGQVTGALAGGGAALRAANRDGGIRTAAATAVGGPAGALTPAGSLAGNSAKGAAVGATYGGISGFGNAEGGAAERMPGAQTGAGYGMVAGAVLPPAITGAGWAIDKATDAISPTLARYGANIDGLLSRAGITERKPATLSAAAADAAGPQAVSGAEAAADQIIANQLSRANVPVSHLRERLAQADHDALYNAGNSRAQQVLAPVDLDHSLQRLAGSAARQQPQAGNIAKDFITARQTGMTQSGRMDGAFGLPTRQSLSRTDKSDVPMGQYERIGDALRRAFRIEDDAFHGHGRTVHVTDQQLIAKAKNDSRPLYAESFKSAEGGDLNPILSPILQTWRSTLIDEPPAVAAALKKSIGYVERAMAPGGNKSHLERFDKVKQWMDDKIDGAMKSDERYYAGRLIEIKNQMLKALDPEAVKGTSLENAFIKYQAARAAFSSPMEARRALQMGRDAIKQDSEIGADAFRALSGVAEQKLFRLGMYGQTMLEAARKKRTADITQMFDTPRMQELLQEAIPRSRRGAVFADRPERFGRYLANEKDMIATRDVVRGGSPTQRNIADDSAFNTMTGIGQAIEDIRRSPSIFAVAIKGVERALDKLFGFRSDTAAFVAHKLFTSSPAEIARTLRQVEDRMGRDRMDQFRRLLSEYQALSIQSISAVNTSGVNQVGNSPK